MLSGFIKTPLYIHCLIFLTISACQTVPQKEITKEELKWTVVKETTGDLDKDNIPEKVIVYNTTDTVDFEAVREVQVLKKNGTDWQVWKKSRNAILGSDQGGMMGDPFAELKIENGILIISHFGGSSLKWGHTDKYRYQNDKFQLIGYSGSGGRPCDEFRTFDFNLSTGKIIYSIEKESCDDNGELIDSKKESETFYKKDVEIFLNNRGKMNLEITSPEKRYSLYL